MEETGNDLFPTNSECSKIPHSPLSESISEPDFYSICSNTSIPDYYITYSSDIPCYSIQSPDYSAEYLSFSKCSSYSKSKLKDDDTIFVSKPRDPRAKILYLSKLEMKCESVAAQIIDKNQYLTEALPLKSNKNKINNDKLRRSEHLNDNNHKKDGIIYEQVKLKSYLDFITDVSMMSVKNSDVRKNSEKIEPKTFGSDGETLSIPNSRNQNDKSSRDICDEYKKNNILPVGEKCGIVTTRNHDWDCSSDNGKKSDSFATSKCNGKEKSNGKESDNSNEKDSEKSNEKDDKIIYLNNNLEERKKIRRKYKLKRFVPSLSENPDKTNLHFQSLKPQLETTHQMNTKSNYYKNNVSCKIKNTEFDDDLCATHSVSKTNHNIAHPFNSPKIKNPCIRSDYSKLLGNSNSITRKKCFGEINETFESKCSNNDLINKTGWTTSTSTKQNFEEIYEPESSEPSSLQNDAQLSTMQELSKNKYVSGLLSVAENKPHFCGNTNEEKDLKSIRSTNFTASIENELVTFSEQQCSKENSYHSENLDKNDKKNISNTNLMENDTFSKVNDLVPLAIHKEFHKVQVSETSDIEQKPPVTKTDEQVCSTIIDEKEASNLKNNINSSIINSKLPSEETKDYSARIMSSEIKQVQDPDLSNNKQENIESTNPNLIGNTEITSCNNSDDYFTILTKEKSERLERLKRRLSINGEDLLSYNDFVRDEDIEENCLIKDNTAWEKSLALSEQDFYMNQEMKRLESCKDCSTTKSFFSSLTYPVNKNEFESKNSSVSDELLLSTDLNKENHHCFKRRKTSVDALPSEDICNEDKYQNKYFKLWIDQAILDEYDIEEDLEIASPDAVVDLPDNETCYKNDELLKNITDSSQDYFDKEAEKNISNQLVNETLIDLQLTDLAASTEATEQQRVDKRKNENNLDDSGNIKRNKKIHSNDRNNKINQDTFLENYLLRRPSLLNTDNQEINKERKRDNGSDIEINEVQKRYQESKSYELIDLCSPEQDSDVQIEEIHLFETDPDLQIIKEIFANSHKERSEQGNALNYHTENYGEITKDKKDNDSFNRSNFNEGNNSVIDNRISLVFDENEIQNEQYCVDKLKAMNPEKRKILLKALQIVQMQEILPSGDYKKKIENVDQLKTNQAIEKCCIKITDSNDDINDSIKNDYLTSAGELSLGQSSAIVENSNPSKLSKNKASKQEMFNDLFSYALKRLKSPRKAKKTKFNNSLLSDSSSCDCGYSESDEQEQKEKRKRDVKYYSKRIRNLKHRNMLHNSLKVIRNANAKAKRLRSVKKRELTTTIGHDASGPLEIKHDGISCRSSLSSDNNKTHRKAQKTKEKRSAKFNCVRKNSSTIMMNKGSRKINQSSINNVTFARRYKRIRPYKTANKIYSSPCRSRVSLEAKPDNTAKRNLFSNDNREKYKKVRRSKIKDIAIINRKKGNNLKGLTKSGGLTGKVKHNISKVTALRKYLNKKLTKKPKLYTLPTTMSLEAQGTGTSKRNFCPSDYEKNKRSEKTKSKEVAKVYCKNKDDSRHLIKYSGLTTESNTKENVSNTLRKSLKSKTTKNAGQVSLPSKISAASKSQHEITTKGDLFSCDCGEKFQRVKTTTKNNANVYSTEKDCRHITKENTFNNITSPRKHIKKQISKETKFGTSPPKVSFVTKLQHENTSERNIVSDEKDGILKSKGNKISVTMKCKKGEKFKPYSKLHNKSSLTDQIKNSALTKNNKNCDTIEYKKDKMSKSILDLKFHGEKSLTNQTNISVSTKNSKNTNAVKYKKNEKSKSKLDEKQHSHKSLTDQITISASSKKCQNNDIVKHKKDEKSKSKCDTKFHRNKSLTNQTKISDLAEKSKNSYTMKDTKDEKSKLKLDTKFHRNKSLTNQTKINDLAEKSKNSYTMKDTKDEKSKLKLHTKFHRDKSLINQTKIGDLIEKRKNSYTVKYTKEENFKLKLGAKLHNEKGLTSHTKVNALAKTDKNSDNGKDKNDKKFNIDAKLYGEKGLTDLTRKSSSVEKCKTNDTIGENSKFYGEKSLIGQKKLIVLLKRVDLKRTCELSKENRTSSSMKCKKVEKIKRCSQKSLADQTVFRSSIKEGKTSDRLVHNSETSKDDEKRYSKKSLTNKIRTNSFTKENKISDSNTTFSTKISKKIELDPLPCKVNVPSKVQDENTSHKDLLSRYYNDIFESQQCRKIIDTNVNFNSKTKFQNKERSEDLRKEKNSDILNPKFETKKVSTAESRPHINTDFATSMLHSELKTVNSSPTKIKSCSQNPEANSPSGSEQSEMSEKDSCESDISAAENKDTINSPTETRKTCCTHPHVNSNFVYPLNFIRN